jgi:hypothetical protein
MSVNSATHVPAQIPQAANRGSEKATADIDSVLTSITFHQISPARALAALWDIGSAQGNEFGLIRQLRGECGSAAQRAVDSNDIRLQISQILASRDPSLAKLGGQLQAAIQDPAAQKDKTTLDTAVAKLVAVHLTASEKVADVRSSMFFSFMYLVKLEVKSAVTDLLSATFAQHTVQSDVAANNVDRAAVTKATCALLRQNIRSPQATPMEKPATIGEVSLTKAAEQHWDELNKALNAMPKTMREHPNWTNVQHRMKAYLNHTTQIQGDAFGNLLKHLNASVEGNKGLSMATLVESMEIHSKLDGDVARQLAFQRQLWNIAQSDRPDSGNNLQVTGWSNSLFNRTAAAARPGQVPDILKPGNQLSLAMDTPMANGKGGYVDVTVLSVIAPALDSSDQPEFALYAKPDDNGIKAFYADNYAKSFDTIKHQVLTYARTHPNKEEFTLAGIGIGAYLNGLGDQANKDQARNIAIGKLAELAYELRKLGKSVDFTDVNGNALQDVNERLAAMKDTEADEALCQPIALAGSIPGDWITDNRVILNAWDSHSLVGNKLKRDPSLDGYIGRNSLVHLTHALRCAMEAEGVPVRSA